jgi:hypothetical protein
MIFRFNNLFIKISMELFGNIVKWNLKFIWNPKYQIANVILRKKNKAASFILPNFKIY